MRLVKKLTNQPFGVNFAIGQQGRSFEGFVGAALSIGAEGIEMGTRFIATKECIHASEAHKRALFPIHGRIKFYN